MYLYTMHQIDDAHLDVVLRDMQQMGAPSIRVVDCGDHYMALEGVHRLRSAFLLDLAPVLIVLDEDEELTTDDLPQWDLVVGETYTAADLAMDAHDGQANGCYQLNDDGTLSQVI